MGKNIEIFISYAIADSKRLHVAELAVDLSKRPRINKIHYWEGWDGYPDGDIINFMENNIENADFFIPICTVASGQSENCEKERKMAISQNLLTIPLYEDFKYVSPALQTFRGIQISNKKVPQIANEVYAQLTAMMNSPAKISRSPLRAIPISLKEKADLQNKYEYYRKLGRQYEKEKKYHEALTSYQNALKRSQELYNSRTTLDMEKRIARVKTLIQEDEFEKMQIEMRLELSGIIFKAEKALEKGDYAKAVSLYEDAAKKALSVWDLRTFRDCKKAASKAREKELKEFGQRFFG